MRFAPISNPKPAARGTDAASPFPVNNPPAQSHAAARHEPRAVRERLHVGVGHLTRVFCRIRQYQCSPAFLTAGVSPRLRSSFFNGDAPIADKLPLKLGLSISPRPALQDLASRLPYTHSDGLTINEASRVQHSRCEDARSRANGQCVL
jgi:hypothetical protein